MSSRVWTPWAGRARELELEIGMGEEHQRLDHRDLCGPGCLLPPQQGAELAGLAVGEEERAVIGEHRPIPPHRPSVGVTFECPRPALDLDEEDPLGSENKQVHLMDGSIFRQELEVGPDGKGLLIGQPLPHEGQSFAFPGKLGRRDRAPAGRRLVHGHGLVIRRPYFTRAAARA